MRIASFWTTLLLWTLLPLTAFANQSVGPSDRQKILEEFSAIQSALERHDTSSVTRLCAGTQLSKYFCDYASLMAGTKTPLEFIRSVPSQKGEFQNLYKFDEYLTSELQKRKIQNPYGAGTAFVYIDQLCLLSYSYPNDAMSALLRMYRYSDGFWGEYLEDKLVKLMFYDRFTSVFAKLNPQYKKEIESLQQTAKRQREAEKISSK